MPKDYININKGKYYEKTFNSSCINSFICLIFSSKRTNGNAKKAKGLTSSSDAGIGDLTSQQEGIVNRLVSGMTNMTSGQAQVARALGLKDQADLLESERDALSSGNVKDKDGIKRSMKVSEDAQEAINTKMAEETVIDAEAKKEFGKALPFYARGTADTIRLLPEIKKWASSASSTMKGRV